MPEAPESPIQDTPSTRFNPNVEDQNMEIKPTVMGPPAFGSPDPDTAATTLLPVVDHPRRASLSEDYGADVIEESDMESTQFAGGSSSGTEDVDEEEMTKEELQDEAEARGLAKSGSKKEIADRIREYDEAQEALEADDESDEDEDQ